jgi:hypothetical protein
MLGALETYVKKYFDAFYNILQINTIQNSKRTRNQLALVAFEASGTAPRATGTPGDCLGSSFRADLERVGCRMGVSM